jgi:hypothetical protein
MTRKAPKLHAIYGTLFAVVAVGLPLMFYASGFRSVGSALLLSSVLVFAFALIKSGALATSWLAVQRRETIKNATRYELAKAMIFAALAVDALSGGLRLMHRFLLYDDSSMMVVLTAAGLLAIVAVLFLTRWFAGYLFTLR